MDLRDPQSVCEVFRAGARANREASCRHGSIDRIGPEGTLIATGDLHDNPIHLAKLVRAAGLGGAASERPRRHLVLHEIIHPDRLINGMDFSYRALAKVAALKAAHPEHVHTLLGNHELAQMVGAQIIKDGVKSVQVFHAGLDFAFADRAGEVFASIQEFIRSMPLALRCVTARGDILVAHSLPPAGVMQRFDAGILSRALTDDDYTPRLGSAYLMVWGRGYDADLLEDLVERWGVWWFVLGHEHVDEGARLVKPNAVVLNSDHERGVYLPIDLARPTGPERAMDDVRAFALEEDAEPV